MLSTGVCRLEGAYCVNWEALGDEEGEQSYNYELGQGCATLSVIGRGSDPSWATSVGHFLLGVGHFLPAVVVVVVVVDGVFVQAIFSMDNALMLVYQTVGGTFPSLSQTGECFLLQFEKPRLTLSAEEEWLRACLCVTRARRGALASIALGARARRPSGAFTWHTRGKQEQV